MARVYIYTYSKLKSQLLLYCIIGGNCHKYYFCHDKHVFVVTKHVFCCDKSMLVFVVTKIFCHDKHNFVMTSILFS